MLLPPAYGCNGCGKVKGETNHWWSILVVADRISLGPFSVAKDCEHYCGAECVQKRVSEFLGGK
jgi:hypothetical protein